MKRIAHTRGRHHHGEPGDLPRLSVGHCSGFWADGFQLTVLLNGHGGSRDITRLVSTKLAEEDIWVLPITYWKMVPAVLTKFARDYPADMRSLAGDLEVSLTYVKLPAVQPRCIRTINLVERSFAKERRWAKVLPRCRSERDCLKLVFGVLWRTSQH
jgi:creatinine amidohydrolase/Fe(II)-dependent formamide hydrolase-like protein